MQHYALLAGSRQEAEAAAGKIVSLIDAGQTGDNQIDCIFVSFRDSRGRYQQEYHNYADFFLSDTAIEELRQQFNVISEA